MRSSLQGVSMKMGLKSYITYPHQGDEWEKKYLEDELRTCSIHSAKWIVLTIVVFFLASYYWNAAVHIILGWGFILCLSCFMTCTVCIGYFFIEIFRNLVSLVFTMQDIRKIDVNESYSEFFLMEFDRFMSSDEVLRDLEENDFRPARLAELLRCKDKYPSLRSDSIVTIGVDESPVETGQLFEGWPPGYKFLVAQK